MKINMPGKIFQFVLGVSLVFTATSVFSDVKYVLPVKSASIGGLPIKRVPDRYVPVKDMPLKGDNQISIGAVISLIDQTLPYWDSSILEARSGENPVNHLSFNDLAVALENQPFKEEPPKGATQIDDGNRALKLDPAKGKVRYVSRTHSWNFRTCSKALAVSESEAHEIASNSLRKLGLPYNEMQKPIVRTQMAGGAKAGANELQDLYEMYRLVYIQRQINGLPVYGDNIKMAVSNEGHIQRLGINWSKFSINQQTELRSREEVLLQAAEEIMVQDPDSTLEIKAQLAYASPSRRNDFKPVVLLSVNSLPTPYQLVVELTNLADEHDME